jgi:hypothetical protein
MEEVNIVGTSGIFGQTRGGYEDLHLFPHLQVYLHV